ncbi:hypothetical protein Ppa06_57720 [Planomonospora parontospora subsp. parontospora]|uniref:Uncharacterized protein n=2 Tax=Planomonospora parontospora TaxID=58119 RepID=A0AA37BMA3_9ACTN|nr:hypothetical protein [Planomonospora parontospora]GGK90633.1 hypothetical protein GCM10010126_57590 [Planomonospora parontospora]GII11974.1 hypothetical protein Ppa06_57720 [Planomonospora parontospora subsp. parontospora]
MSRHTITTPDGRTVLVGWDRPTSTFYAMGLPMFWYGTSTGELDTVEDLAEVLRPHGVTLPDDLVRQLVTDRMNEGRLGRPTGIGGQA